MALVARLSSQPWLPAPCLGLERATRRGRRITITMMMAMSMIAVCPQAAPPALELKPGPHLFIDDYLIGEQSFLSRTVNRPVKRREPIVTGIRPGGDGNCQPYLSVLRDPETGRFRIWYDTQDDSSGHWARLCYMESEDGIQWIRPPRILQVPPSKAWGVSVIDRGRKFPQPESRYLLAFRGRKVAVGEKVLEPGGLKIAVSPNGFDWRMLSPKAVLLHRSDIGALHWDPIRNRFLAIVLEAPAGASRGVPYQSVSRDLLDWEEKWIAILPKPGAPIEQGETHFYGMSGVVARGDLLIGLVKVLRDDLNATPGKSKEEMGDDDPTRKAAGLGYTVLGWSRDGRRWQRDHEPFLDRDPDPAGWDHAMAWGDDQMVVGEETYVYYGGYKRGHKIARFEGERQIGLARMPRDRYVAREANLNTGRLVTKPVILRGTKMTVNANVVGEMRVRLLDGAGRPLKDFDWVPIRGDSIEHRVAWKQSIGVLQNKPVRVEFELRDASLFGFDLRR